MRTALLFGAGYLGARVAQRWLTAGYQVQIVTRSPQRAAQFAGEGFSTLVADVTDATSLRHLPRVDVALFAVGFDRQSATDSGPTIADVYVGGTRNMLAQLSPTTGRLIYISTTGVYGDAGGGWVDEGTPPAPTRPGGIASLAAEEALRKSPFADRTVILRLAGIYGPDRLPYLQQLVAGKPIAAVQAGYLNLIHVDDAASVVERVAAHDFTVAGPLTYCVSDGQPPVRRDYYHEVARLLAAPEPQFETPPTGSHRAARGSADKRVSNRCLLAATGIQLRYPSYREGLAQIVENCRNGD